MQIPVPDSATYLFELEKKSIRMNAGFDHLKEWLMSRSS